MKSRGMTGKHHSEASKQKMSESAKRYYQTHPEAPQKMGGFRGKHHSIITRQKIKKANPHYWRNRHLSELTKEKLRDAHLGKKRDPFSESTKQKLREIQRTHWQDPEFIRKVMKGQHSKTRPECALEEILDYLYPGEFKYNGCFECGISLDGLIPDFVNVNGKKQVLDIHGSYWHKNEDINIRAERYAKCGYSSLIIWDHELENRVAITVKIRNFYGERLNE